MNKGYFYFLADQYFIDFPDQYLMKNKEVVDGVLHDRPCFYAFPDDKNPYIFWMIPFSSRIQKFKELYNKKTSNGKKCNTIKFGNILGKEKAFLIQNICPITEKYIKNEYFDSNGKPIRLNYKFEQELVKDAKDVLKKYNRGNKFLIFPDITSIYNKLIQEQN